MIHESTTQFTWSTPSYEKSVRTVDWYWALGIIVVAGAVIAIVAKNFLFAFLIVMSGVLVVLYGRKEPDVMNVEVSNRGVTINKNMFTYESIKGFWMYRDHKDRARLILATKRPIMPKIMIPLPADMDYMQLHEFLTKQATETEMYESRIDIITESLGL